MGDLRELRWYISIIWILFGLIIANYIFFIIPKKKSNNHYDKYCIQLQNAQDNNYEIV